MRRYQMLADRLSSADLSITALLLDDLEQVTVEFDNGLSLFLVRGISPSVWRGLSVSGTQSCQRELSQQSIYVTSTVPP